MKAVYDARKKPEVVIDNKRREILINGEPVHFTPIEYRLIKKLMASSKCWSRDELLEVVWGAGSSLADTRVVDQAVAKCRKNVHGCIETVTGFGYRWKR